MGATRKDIMEKIAAATLTASENHTIEKLINNLDATVFLSGTQMAEFCEISPTSMTRLTQKLGYAKLSEFKIELEELYRKSISPSDMFEDYISSDTSNEIVVKSLQNDLDNIKKMQDTLDEEVLKTCVKGIIKTRKVYVIGMFSSEAVVRMITYDLWRIGKPYKDYIGLGCFQKFKYSDIKPGDVLIAISSQRVFKEVFEAVKYANENDMLTIAITDNFSNPLAREADHTLVAPVKGKVFDCTHAATFALLDIMFNMIASEMREELKFNLLEEERKGDYKDLFCV